MTILQIGSDPENQKSALEQVPNEQTPFLLEDDRKKPSSRKLATFQQISVVVRQEIGIGYILYQFGLSVHFSKFQGLAFELFLRH